MSNVKLSNNTRLSLFIFIDALGWEVLKDRKFLDTALPHRKKLRSVFGYSSACVPSILSGEFPQEHGHWSFYFADRETSPFKTLSWMRYLPFQNHHRIRHQLSRLVKKRLGWTGYFQLYNMPLQHLDKFNYCEQRDLFEDRGLNRGSQIFEQLKQMNISFHVSDWRRPEADNLQYLKRDLIQCQPRFAFLYMADMDGLLHKVGKDSPAVDVKLAWYEEEIRKVEAIARTRYEHLDIFVFSDHGMATVTRSIDVMTAIDGLGFEFGTDYLAAYDSTMARFWFYNDKVRRAVTEYLGETRFGRIIEDDELSELGCKFDGQQYGQLIYLLEPGCIICPSHMGTKPVTGMHGYHPDDKDSDAVLLSSKLPSTHPQGITDLFQLMRTEAAL